MGHGQQREKPKHVRGVLDELFITLWRFLTEFGGARGGMVIDDCVRTTRRKVLTQTCDSLQI